MNSQHFSPIARVSSLTADANNLRRGMCESVRVMAARYYHKQTSLLSRQTEMKRRNQFAFDAVSASVMAFISHC